MSVRFVLLATVDCVGEVGFGARVWIVGAWVDLVQGCGLHRQGLVWRVSVDCVGEVGIGAWKKGKF